jgi:hypothetical protein
VGADEIPSFIIKGFYHTLPPLLTYMFGLNVTREVYPSLLKQTAVVPVFKRAESTRVGNYRPISFLQIVRTISLLKNICRIRKFAIHDHLYNFFNVRFIPFSMVSETKSCFDLFGCLLNNLQLSVSIKKQSDSIYFYFSNISDIGHAAAYLVEALCYKPKGHGFDSRWGH